MVSVATTDLCHHSGKTAPGICSPRQYVNEWGWLCSNETLLRKTGGPPAGFALSSQDLSPYPLTFCSQDPLNYLQFPVCILLSVNTVFLHPLFTPSGSPSPISLSSSPPLILMVQFKSPHPLSHQHCVPTY